MKRTVTYDIENCNSTCPWFYYNYTDYDNIWCGKLNKRIFENEIPLLCGDFRIREFPKECSLPISEE
jgi:hypothetical protein